MQVNNFILPTWACGRFAVVKLWPGVNAAEDENIARMKNTARDLGIKCVEITPDGILIGSNNERITKKNCDFVIHLHFETPKAYDVFSFVALWNPLQFYHDWGYEKFSKHLLSHDDFLTCNSPWADDHVLRLIINDLNHLAPKFTFFHSLSTPIHSPDQSENKIFYAGINWEKLGKGKSRHQELLDLLDKDGTLKIYGPKIFQGVDVWEGYKSYVSEIPFDGVSMVNEISKCGIALVLSSAAHKESQLMSNRLFESLAAGAAIICDENPFAKKHLGDTIFYFDARDPIDQQHKDILKHISWIKQNPEETMQKVKKAQSIFLNTFSLDKSIASLYDGLQQRKSEIESTRFSKFSRNEIVIVNFLMPTYDSETLAKHLNSASTQEYPNILFNLVIDVKINTDWLDVVMEKLSAFIKLKINIVVFEFFEINNSLVKIPKKVGSIINELIGLGHTQHNWLVVAPNEILFSSHVTALAAGLARNTTWKFCASSVLYAHSNAEGKKFHDMADGLFFESYVDNRPNGFGRFLFRPVSTSTALNSTLKYLDKLCLLPFIDNFSQPCENFTSLVIDIQNEYPKGEFNQALELGVISDLGRTQLLKNVDQKIVTQNLSNLDLAPQKLTFTYLSRSNKSMLLKALVMAYLPDNIGKIVRYVSKPKRKQ